MVKDKSQKSKGNIRQYNNYYTRHKISNIEIRDPINYILQTK